MKKDTKKVLQGSAQNYELISDYLFDFTLRSAFYLKVSAAAPIPQRRPIHSKQAQTSASYPSTRVPHTGTAPSSSLAEAHHTCPDLTTAED